jgi:head-tail adaptor
MKLVKTYENFIDFDSDFAIAKIKHFYTEYDVKNMVDDEIENWVEEEQIGDSYEGKVDWYYDNASGEAEEVVIDQLIDWYEKEFKKELTEDQRIKLSDRILKEYPGIDPNNY